MKHETSIYAGSGSTNIPDAVETKSFAFSQISTSADRVGTVTTLAPSFRHFNASSAVSPPTQINQRRHPTLVQTLEQIYS